MNLQWTPPNVSYLGQSPPDTPPSLGSSFGHLSLEPALSQSVPNHRRRRSSVSSSLNHQFQCPTCGKRYKHPNCLSKHKWEHHDGWKTTSKLAISKHQQVQLLEAASILVGLGSDDIAEEGSLIDSDETTFVFDQD
jgi:hypothetical protein